MASNVKPIGKRISLINPNDFSDINGFNSGTVPLEDLTISVQLTTKSKERSVLTTTQQGGETVGSTTESVTINFIEGAEIGVKGTPKFLTTSYTDLTTNLDPKKTVDENLGITNIDIDFNTSYAPMITINFIDVRGRAIFQHGAESKYGVLFQLPYPLFQLTIKGYYGRPVTYCLHMTKVSSRFNSQTGNFEITANFIGYTYAMLTDMLLGFMKAIPYTTIGKTYFEKLKLEDPTIITLTELLKRCGQIDNLIDKIKSESESAKKLSTIVGIASLLGLIEDNITNTINDLITGVDNGSINNPDSEAALFPIDTTTSSKIVIRPDEKSFGRSLELHTNSNGIIIQSYIDTITNSIDNYNNLAKNYNLELNSTDQTTLTSPIIYRNPPSTGSNNIDVIKNIITDTIKDQNAAVKIYDFTSQLKVISDTKQLIQNEADKATKDMANELRAKVKDKDGLQFDPSIRNIIKILTVHVEALLHTIWTVASNAKNNTERLTQFNNFASVDLDNGKPTSKVAKVVYPWPEYNRLNATTGVNEETYLGTTGILLEPKKVNEVAFIDDLYSAMITEAKEEQTILTALNVGKTAWYPINPMDTVLFQPDLTFPYSRLSSENTVPDYVREVMLRAVAFLGVTNKHLDPETEIKKMAETEADSFISSHNVVDADIKKLILGMSQERQKNDFLGIKGKNNNSIVTPNSVTTTGNYKYNYITLTPTNGVLVGINQNININPNEPYNVLPIVGGYNGEFVNNPTTTNIITNYSTSTVAPKLLDGGTYIKIIENDAYIASNNVKLVDGGPANTTTKLIFGKLNDILDTPDKLKGAGFNAFGGSYGIQEFSSIDWGQSVPNGDNLSSRFLFYGTGFEVAYVNKINVGNDLCLGRNFSGIDSLNPVAKTVFDKTDTPNSEFIVPLSPNVGGNPAIGFTGLIRTIYDDDTSAIRAVHNKNGGNRVISNEFLTNPNKFSYPYINFVIDTTFEIYPVSLFGSRFYYKQTIEEVRALLFLHSFPWNGFDNGNTIINNPTRSGGVVTALEVLNLFANRAGFIQVPTLWTAFVGGLLWRYHYSETHTIVDPIIWTTTNGESLLPTFPSNSDKYPTVSQYLTRKPIGRSSLGSLSFSNSGNYFDLEKFLINLPEQVQNEFISDFEKFVADDWPTFKQKLEVFTSNPDTWENTWGIVQTKINVDSNGTPTLNVSNINNIFTNFDKYIIFTPLCEKDSKGVLLPLNQQDEFKYNYFLELKDDVSQLIVTKMVNDFKWIANTTYRVWGNDNINNDGSALSVRTPIVIPANDLNIYIDAFIAEIQTKSKSFTSVAQSNQINDTLFGTNENNDIKLNLYRTVKAIYDKWVGGANNANGTGTDIVFQCCKAGGKFNGRNKTDSALAEQRGGTEPRLIDSFRFVSRSFNDIGDDLLINPKIITQLLQGSPTQSFYDILSRILTDNNFEFVALPTFINYNDTDELKNVFTPSPNNTDKGSGPSFVCVYVGQSSTKLDFGNKGFYPNDSFDLTGIIPPDFNSDIKPYEDRLGAFEVNYGQQNQNIFKDVTLDQNEFSETSESLQITDDLSKKLGETNRALAGQNMYNVYSVRSYKAEIEMMGNAMIQPMMYFQLNNIPMFHGAYMITHVKHNIKPNYMTTHFTGNRIKRVGIKLIDSTTLFTSILGDFMSSISGNTTPITAGSITKNSLDCALTTQAIKTYIGVGWDGKDSTLVEAWLKFIIKKDYAPQTDVDNIRIKLNALAIEFNFNAYDLIKVFSIESFGGNPTADNGSCFGIIQWCQTTGAELLVNFSAIKNQNNVPHPIRDKNGRVLSIPTEWTTFISNAIKTSSLLKQLDYVETYFKQTSPFANKVGHKVLADLYLTVLFPAGINIVGLDTPITDNKGNPIPGPQAKVLYSGSGCKKLSTA